MAESRLLPAPQRISTTDHVLRALRDSIIEGRLPQGAQLRELHLAETLGTGRGPVREAIRQLIQEGLVEYRLNRGAFVRVMTVEDAIDVYRAREAIESFAASLACQTPAPLDLSEAKRRLKVLRRVARGQDRLSLEATDADLCFHMEIVSVASSPRLTRTYETLAAEARMVLHRHPPWPWRDYLAEHERILEALGERDPATPELISQHYQFSARLIAEVMRGAGAPDEPARAPSGGIA